MDARDTRPLDPINTILNIGKALFTLLGVGFFLVVAFTKLTEMGWIPPIHVTIGDRATPAPTTAPQPTSAPYPEITPDLIASINELLPNIQIVYAGPCLDTFEVGNPCMAVLYDASTPASTEENAIVFEFFQAFVEESYKTHPGEFMYLIDLYTLDGIIVIGNTYRLRIDINPNNWELTSLTQNQATPAPIWLGGPIALD